MEKGEMMASVHKVAWSMLSFHEVRPGCTGSGPGKMRRAARKVPLGGKLIAPGLRAATMDAGFSKGKKY